MKDQLIIKFCSEPTTNRLPLHDFAHETLQQLVLIVPLYVFLFKKKDDSLENSF